MFYTSLRYYTFRLLFLFWKHSFGESNLFKFIFKLFVFALLLSYIRPTLHVGRFYHLHSVCYNVFHKPLIKLKVLKLISYLNFLCLSKVWLVFYKNHSTEKIQWRGCHLEMFWQGPNKTISPQESSFWRSTWRKTLTQSECAIHISPSPQVYLYR